ncbi:uncharacterized protein LOC132042383 [Lycium ferocissimum]|uniref:uncharacterized protein LOC132042383 n=1 Tax=Lycium ferocissimum TaxID=112874 RepID=UPI0028163897|nr:uncharacterized protein LOC132042383 [Lycium ferocissimum]
MKTEMVDFNFDSACTTPYISAPSSPQHFGTAFFFSAPTSPTRISALYGETNVTRYNDRDDDNADDFAFEFNGHELEKNIIISGADELFDGGKIKPLFESPISPKLRLKGKKNAIEPIVEAKERTQNSIRNNSSGSSRHKATRSLSPLRVSDLLLIDEDDESIDQEKTESSVSSLISLWNSWKLKDLLLFRSASESRASSSTEELNKYSLVKKIRREDVKKSSVLNSRRKMRRPISAHELHYKMKKEMLKDMKKKTFLPYKQGLLGWHGCTGLDDTISAYMTPR